MAKIREFDYNSKGEVKHRKVLVIHESDTSFAGLDLTLLSEDESKEVQSLLKEHEPHAFPAKGEHGTIDGYKPEWNKAWRRFNESGIVMPPED